MALSYNCNEGRAAIVCATTTTLPSRLSAATMCASIVTPVDSTLFLADGCRSLLVLSLKPHVEEIV